MRFDTKGIVLWVKKLEENGAMIQCITQDKGLISGFVRSVNSKKVKNAIEVGSLISINYYGKEKPSGASGTIVPELIKNYVNSCIQHKLSFFMVLCICQCTHFLFGKHHVSHGSLSGDQHTDQAFAQIAVFMQQCSTCQTKDMERLIAARFVITMKNLLTESGYGFSLSSCVATGEANPNELTFISLKSASAVSKAAAQPYPGKFLKMPRFFIDEDAQDNISPAQIEEGITIIDAFLSKIAHNYISEQVPKIWADTAKVIKQSILPAAI